MTWAESAGGSSGAEADPEQARYVGAEAPTPKALKLRAPKLTGCGKTPICHPEPASFAGEGAAVSTKAKENAGRIVALPGDVKKQIRHRVQKPNGVRDDIFLSRAGDALKRAPSLRVSAGYFSSSLA
jgi:hypothetical protein